VPCVPGVAIEENETRAGKADEFHGVTGGVFASVKLILRRRLLLLGASPAVPLSPKRNDLSLTVTL